MSYPRVTTRGHFETTWYGSVVLTDGNTPSTFEFEGDEIPGVHTDPVDELLVHAHSWNNDFEGGVCSVEETGTTFAAEGYDYPVVGYTWDADFGWYSATEITEQNGSKPASFVSEYAEANPSVAVRLCCHSLGARVVLSALESLAEWGRTGVGESTTLLGGAADAATVSMGGRYGSSIEAATGRLDNHSNNWNCLHADRTAVVRSGVN
ncbi:alpha/beta hydrolase [Natronorubrum halalkaliphilum]|uniref:alpha/beta hydrolase n=1 Tax=Natronorubrum halalkaliphilum TaxID=2691917 RepID=UPI001F2A8D83|nr:alpha/beta hydrolase [Natronorubrum halalkaliphilum]